MKYFVTLCMFDRNAGANPAWHSGLILSKETATNQLEAIDAWGFYGLPSTGERDHWFTQFKRSVGLDLDFFGNHGWLVREEIRFMDLGQGLHGDTFELTKEQLTALQNECNKRLQDQKAAVDEALQELGIKPNPEEKVRYYAGEKYSQQIYALEKKKAELEKREPRLHPFDFTLSWKTYRPSLQGSHTCKTEALDILSKVLPAEKLKPYQTHTFPRFVSSGMEDVILYSKGPKEIHAKSTGEQVFFRNRENPKVKLMWSVPPQKIAPLPDSNTKEMFTVDPEYCDEAKKVVSKLQRLEWLLRNTPVPKKYEAYQNNLLKRIVSYYREFSVLRPDLKNRKIGGLMGCAYSLFGLPRNGEQAHLKKNIDAAKYLFNSLYMAIVDGWEIIDTLPPEPPVISVEHEVAEENPLEALAAYLPIEVQKKICAIIERNYCSNELMPQVSP